MKKVVFLADAHIGAQAVAAQELVTYIRASLEGAVGVYLLGDVFHYAVGLPSFRTPALELIVDFLGELARSGLAVGYVAGNRDYFAPRMFARHPGVVVTEESLDIEPFGVPVHLLHGDTLNPDDRQYLLWRRVSRSLPVRLAASALPSFLAHRLGDRIESGLKATNQGMRIHFPEGHVASYGARVVDGGRRLVLLGHFHQARSLPVRGASGAEGSLHVLPDWLSRRSHAELHEDGRFVLDVRADASTPGPSVDAS